MVMTPLPPQGLSSTTPVSLPTDREQRDISRLRQILEKEQSRPTTMSTTEFKKFAPLFQKPKEEMTNREAAIFDEKVRKLTEAYLRRIDMYKEVHVVDQQGAIILKIPPLFVQFSSLSPTRENDDAVLANRKLCRSDIPRFRDQALARLNEALINQQKGAEQREHVQEVTQKTHTLLDEFFTKKLGLTQIDVSTDVSDAPETEADKTPERASISTGKCIDL